MKKRQFLPPFRWVIVASLIGLGFGGWLNLGEMSVSALFAQDSLPSFTVTATKDEHIGVRADGTKIERHGTLTEALRGDGSVATWEEGYSPDPELAPFGNHVRHGRILLTPRKAYTLVFPEAESVSTFPFPDKHIAHLRKPKECETTSPEPAASNASIESLLGYRVVRRTSTAKVDNVTESIIEQWLAPALNCFPLKGVTLHRKPDGSVRILQTIEAVRVVTGEPDPKLFEVPANYVEGSPLESAARMADRKGVPRPINHGILKSTSRYQEMQKNRARP